MFSLSIEYANAFLTSNLLNNSFDIFNVKNV